MVAIPGVDNDTIRDTRMIQAGEEPNEDKEKERAEMLLCADVKLHDAGNIAVSRHSRVAVC